MGHVNINNYALIYHSGVEWDVQRGIQAFIHAALTVRLDQQAELVCILE